MQYNITLPADYDIGNIRQRIAEKGHLMDNFPNLEFKAFLYACRAGGEVKSRDNLYAPFYLWEDAAGLNRFLCGSGFAALSQAFGRPRVTVWSVWQAKLASSLGDVCFATREIVPIAPGKALDQLRAVEAEEAVRDSQEKGALAVVTAFEPAGWTLVRFRLWGSFWNDSESPEVQAYEVGHLALSDA